MQQRIEKSLFSVVSFENIKRGDKEKNQRETTKRKEEKANSLCSINSAFAPE